MGSGLYVLNEAGEPVEVEDVLKWAAWMASADRKVAKDEVLGAEVSTVFLGISTCSNLMNSDWDMNYLFETMVFTDGNKELQELLAKSAGEDITSIFAKFLGGYDVQRRYRTRTEALAGHASMVEFVRRVLSEDRISRN